MPNRRGSDAQRPSVPAAELLCATRRDLRMLAMNSKGKLAYLPSLDYIFKEIYGIKHIASRLISKKDSEARKIYGKIQMDTLMYILLDAEVHDILRQAVILHNKLEKDASLTSKEVKKYEKKIRTMCDVIRKDFNIKKQKNEDDIDIKHISAFIDRRSDDYGYYFDDDDDGLSYGYNFYDDDDDDRYDTSVISRAFGSSRRRKSQPNSELARVVDKYERPRHNYDYEEEAWEGYDEIKGIRDEDDEDDDISRLVDLIGNFSDRLEGLEDLITKPKPNTNIYALPEEKPVTPKPTESVKSVNPTDAGVPKMLSDISRMVRQQSVDMNTLQKKTGQALGAVCNKIEQVSAQVNELAGAYDEMYEQVFSYADDDTDEFVASSDDVPGVTMDEVINALNQDSKPAPIDASSPVNVKNLGGNDVSSV